MQRLRRASVGLIKRLFFVRFAESKFKTVKKSGGSQLRVTNTNGGTTISAGIVPIEQHYP